MKELIGKKARIEAPAVFDGVQTLDGFEYNDAGTVVRWRGMPDAVRQGVSVGLLSIVEVLPNAERPATKEKELTLEDVPAELRDRIANDVSEQMCKNAQGMIDAAKKEFAEKETELRRQIEAEVRAKLAEEGKRGKGAEKGKGAEGSQ